MGEQSAETLAFNPGNAAKAEEEGPKFFLCIGIEAMRKT